jgi:hypothetical protein
MKRSCAIVLLALALIACRRGRAPEVPAPPPPPPPPALPAPFSLLSDNSGGIQDSTRQVIRDDGAYRSAWDRATSRQDPRATAQAVDFTRDMVVLVTAGRRAPDEGIRVDSVRMSPPGGTRVLTIFVTTTTGCGRFTTNVFPLEMVRIGRFEGTVSWNERTERAPGCRGSPPPFAERGRVR